MIKNVVLAIALLNTTAPIHTFQPEFHKVYVRVLNNLLENESQEIRLLAIQSMRALLLLSTKENTAISQIGQHYVRLFLPILTTKLLVLSPAKEIENDYMLLCEELLAVFVVLAGSQINLRQSNMHLTRISCNTNLTFSLH